MKTERLRHFVSWNFSTRGSSDGKVPDIAHVLEGASYADITIGLADYKACGTSIGIESKKTNVLL
jgi:hypothetical protein